MNILLITGNNPLKSSGSVSLDLLNEFKNAGHSAKLLVSDYDKNYPDDVLCIQNTYLFWKKKIVRKIKKVLLLEKRSIPRDYKYCFHGVSDEKTYYRTKTILKRVGSKHDIILVLFTKLFINQKNIYELNKITGAPIYWYMYDMAPLTGGCHYAWDCEGYKNSCGSCPGLYSSTPHDITNKNLLYKKSFIEKTNINIVAGSEWQYNQAKESYLFKNKPIHKILLAINSNIFKPIAIEYIRNKIGIPIEKKVIFFGAVNLNDERKGMNFLLDCLKALKTKIKDTDLENKILLLIAGRDISEIEKSLPFSYHYMGMLDNTYGIASAYQAADVFVCPSIEDSGPSMINQSLMCGTPIVSFQMGVSPDLVITGKTGYLARLKDAEDLAQGIYYMLNVSEAELSSMKENCRNLALKLIQPSECIKSWLNLINHSHEKTINDPI